MKDFFARLSWADYIAAAFFLRGLYVGYRSGIFAEFLRTVLHLGAVIAAMLLGPIVGQYLTLNTFVNEATGKMVGFAAVLVAVLFAAMVLRKLVLKVLKVGEGGGLQRLLGAVLGGARWIVLLSLVFVGVAHSPLKQLQADVKERSLTGALVSQVAPALFGFMGQLSPELSSAQPTQTKAK